MSRCLVGVPAEPGFFDANYYFNKDQTTVQPRAPLRQNQFGAGVGGPVSIPKMYDGKDRIFFFAACK